MIHCNLVLACSGLLGKTVLKSLFGERIIGAVLTDKRSSDIIDFCIKNGIDYFVGSARSDNCFKFIQKYKESVLFSVNYLFLFNKRILNLFQNKFNIHGSLLPKYRGRTPHVWAIINNEKKTGITIHDIVLECDAGDIFLQKEIPINYYDTGSTILGKYLYHYPKMVKQFLNLFLEQKLFPQKQDRHLSTFFIKRTPEDGRIIWSWQRERIYNWVRALAPPYYPGAFCFLENVKIVIIKIKISNFGFSFNMKDGTILHVGKDSFIVKTPNGCVEVIDYVKDSDNIFKNGDILT